MERYKKLKIMKKFSNQLHSNKLVNKYKRMRMCEIDSCESPAMYRNLSTLVACLDVPLFRLNLRLSLVKSAQHA
jgi:hypothetical protein